MDFYIDTVGGESDTSSEEHEDSSVTNNTLVQALLKEYKSTKLEDLDCTPQEEPRVKSDAAKCTADWKEENLNGSSNQSKLSTSGKTAMTRRDEAKQILKKSVITPDFEKLRAVPRYDVSQKRLKLERKKEREKTKGGKWFGMPATELTDEVKRDLEVIQMRSVLDPKHFYKKNDMNELPKYFQIGKVVDAPLDACLTKKERKKTLVGELLADFEFRKYNKRKYKEIIEEKQKTHYKAWRNAKKLKKKK